MREIRPLTSLRAFAALLVFLYHYAVLHAPDGGAGVPLRAIWAHGYMGVPMFFVLSGFLITRLYFDPLRGGTAELRVFLIKRIARIWPLFLVLAVVQHGALWLHGLAAPTTDWLVTLSMSQGWFADLLHKGLPPAWSLTIEETFYLLAPGFFLVIDRLVFGGDRAAPMTRRRTAGLMGTLALLTVTLAGLGAIGWWLSARLGLDWRGFLAGPDHVLRMTLAGRFPEFAVGMAAAFVHRDGRWLRRLRPVVAGWAGVILVAAIGALLAVKGIAPPGGQYLVHNAVAVATGLLVLVLSVPGHLPARILSQAPLVYLGRISYGFYLIQLSVVSAPLVALAARCGPWRLPVHLVLAVAVCALLFELVEKPARRAIVARWADLRPVAAGVTPPR